MRLECGEDPGAAPLPLGVGEIDAAVAGADTILDVGCGSGRLTVELARRGARATGIDTHGGRLAAARDRALDAYGKAREAIALAPRLSLDAAATAFVLGGMLAAVADLPASLKR